jgi:putative flippase GtrA
VTMGGRKNALKQLVSYGIVGLASFCIDVSLTTAAYDVLRVSPFAAGVVGFVAGFLFGFPVNRKHVFDHTKHDKYSLRTQVTAYAGLCGANLLITGTLTQLLVEDARLRIFVAKVCVTALIAVWNFFILKYLVFSKRPRFTDIEDLLIQ